MFINPRELFLNEYGHNRKYKQLMRDLQLANFGCSSLDEFNPYYDPEDEESEEYGPSTLALKFHPSHNTKLGDLVMAANESGMMAMIQTNAYGNVDYNFKRFKLHNNSIFDLCWRSENSADFATASGDQRSRLFTFKADGIYPLNEFIGHTQTVKTVDFNPLNENILTTASRDNTIRIWDSRLVTNDNCVNYIRDAHTGLTKSSSQHVTCAKFKGEHHLVSCGDRDGIVKMWDARKTYSAYTKTPKAIVHFNYYGKSNYRGFTYLSICPDGRFVFASCGDGAIYQYDLFTFDKNPLAIYKGFQNNHYIRSSLSPDGQYLASGSINKKAFIWKVQNNPFYQNNSDQNQPMEFEPFVALEGHDPDEVTCIDWCRNDFRLITCADNNQHRIWKISSPNTDLDKVDENGYKAIVGRAKIHKFNQQPNNMNELSKNKNKQSVSYENSIEPKELIRRRSLALSKFPNFVLDKPYIPPSIRKKPRTSWLEDIGNRLKAQSVNSPESPKSSPLGRRTSSSSPRVTRSKASKARSQLLFTPSKSGKKRKREN